MLRSVVSNSLPATKNQPTRSDEHDEHDASACSVLCPSQRNYVGPMADIESILHRRNTEEWPVNFLEFAIHAPNR
jgi:hypothetical protein